MLGDNTWILAVNLVIWTGLFLYLMYLNKKVRELEKDR
ncbi:MAG: CcmD family protein [Acidobacteria bacterium]|nr:CcmD family protein [Acidobacteriota bacterium]